MPNLGNDTCEKHFEWVPRNFQAQLELFISEIFFLSENVSVGILAILVDFLTEINF